MKSTNNQQYLNFVQIKEPSTTKNESHANTKKGGIVKKMPTEMKQTEKLYSQNSVEAASNGGSAGNFTSGHSNLLNKLGTQNLMKNKKAAGDKAIKDYYNATSNVKQKYGSGMNHKNGVGVNQKRQQSAIAAKSSISHGEGLSSDLRVKQ